MSTQAAATAAHATSTRARPDRLHRVRDSVATHQAEWITMTVVLMLFVFYYAARADSIGTLSPGGGWTTVTLPPLGPATHYLVSALLLAIIPVTAARVFGGKRPRDLGLGLGRKRAGLVILAIGVPIVLLGGKIGAGSPVMRAVYPLNPALTPDGFLSHAGLTLLYYGSWEILFRGVLLFGLKDRLGAGFANVLQTALSVVAHFGRPMTETFAALPAGLLMGWVGLRLRSIWYVAIIHWLVGLSVDWFLITG
jgi:membrane protease YdiL (CAAX protease family)